MNQPNAPVVTPKVSSSTEAPELMVVFKRFRWLLVAGVVFGAGIATAMHLACLKY
jgi:hypothetical protein